MTFALRYETFNPSARCSLTCAAMAATRTTPIVFFAVAAGSILYVVQELFAVNRKFGFPILVSWMLLLGLALGFGTDFVLEAVGA